MSRFLASRIARLEAKRKANEPPPRLIAYSLDGEPLWRIEESADGILRFVPRFTSEEFAERCRNQQADLMNRLAAYEADLTESEEGTVEHGRDTGPSKTGYDGELAPLFGDVTIVSPLSRRGELRGGTSNVDGAILGSL